MREFNSVEEKILDRALYLIGKNHSCKISIRAIAKEAGVNVSAINYYFRSKEEMLKQAKELYIANSNSIIDILKDENISDEEKLIIVSNEIMEYNMRYPGITVLLHDASGKEDDISRRIIEVSDELLRSVNSLLENLIRDKDSDIHFQRMIFWAGINFPLDNNILHRSDTDKLGDKDTRINYINYLLNILRK